MCPRPFYVSGLKAHNISSKQHCSFRLPVRQEQQQQVVLNSSDHHFIVRFLVLSVNRDFPVSCLLFLLLDFVLSMPFYTRPGIFGSAAGFPGLLFRGAGPLAVGGE